MLISAPDGNIKPNYGKPPGPPDNGVDGLMTFLAGFGAMTGIALVFTMIGVLKYKKQVISTDGRQVLSTIPLDNIERLSPCTHEESDTRILLHAADAVQCGYTKILLRTVDTDVLVLAVACVDKLQQRDGIELWVAFGTGVHFRCIAAHEIARRLNPQVSSALPVFHAFTGCDTVSCFNGKGKKTAMETWNSYPDATASLLALANTPLLYPVRSQ
ncbi:hypothetical protein QZH41_004867 [Actinostola sp. cb2023]|nr:hypothetical protein QZH41_004867 [Actinostola sp. cb2023]